MHIVLIDNFDSFTFNIVQAYQQLGVTVKVVRNHATLQQIEALNPNLLVIGPGPGNPKGAGICRTCIQRGFPVFGICLGHQIIGDVFGASIVRAPYPIHGKTSRILHKGEGVFKELPQGFLVTRYHSLVICPHKLPEELSLTAWTEEGVIMGICHRYLPIAGVQFHPESIATEGGLQLLSNSLYLKTKHR